MSKFKVGDRVLCVKTHSQGVVVKGRYYIIQGISECAGCNIVTLDVGLKSRSLELHCPICNTSFIAHSDVWWISNRLFVKADEQDNYASEVLKEIAEQIEVEFIELHNK